MRAVQYFSYGGGSAALKVLITLFLVRNQDDNVPLNLFLEKDEDHALKFSLIQLNIMDV
jgi:hypothetical protein